MSLGPYGGGAGILSAPTAFGAPERANPILFVGAAGAITYGVFTGFLSAGWFKGNLWAALALGLVGGYLVTEIAVSTGYVPGWYVGQTVYAAPGFLFGGSTQTLQTSLADLVSGASGSTVTVNLTTPLTILAVQSYTDHAGNTGTALRVQTAQGQTGWINSSSVSSTPST
jgi:hypothetical protein